MSLPIAAPVLRRHAGLVVLRDDLLLGGSKVRVLPSILRAAKREDFVYATPVQGHAQLALAVACKAMGLRAHVVCAKRSRRHPTTEKVADLGARLIEVDPGYLTVAQYRARMLAEEIGGHLLPWGFNCPEMLDGLANVARSLHLRPKEVWSAAGSGTLQRALQMAWPRAKFHAVQVGRASDFGSAKTWVAPEPFDGEAREPPPFPSCSHFDAKAWAFIRAHARRGALFWNVAA